MVPAEREEAKKRMLFTGKSRSSSRRRITLPTWPVAPTTAMSKPGVVSLMVGSFESWSEVSNGRTARLIPVSPGPRSDYRPVPA